MPSRAEAVDSADTTEESLSDLQTRVEESADAYDEATARVAELQGQIADTEAQIEQLEAELPAQEERCSDAVRSLYMFEQDNSRMIDMLLSSQSFGEFLSTFEYFTRVNQYNVDAVNETATMKQTLEDSKASLEQAETDAQTQATIAENALTAAEDAREEAAAAAAAEAAAQEAAAQAAAAQAAQEAAAQQAAAAQASAATTTTTTTVTAETPDSSVSATDVNWSVDKTAFVNEWSARIDSYLAGSPLSGQGTNFAAAAWDYGVDPRFSPAISYAESSKGAQCFRSYNAWGWGSYSYSSWEEAIYAHVRGLARGYGGALTYEGACKYCPSNPDGWYNTVAAQMALI